ncbi:hypothetical protein FNV43_RR08454 [Rhamnella rubrinervis]|uniref:Uncharacterized protein n=1 Tax=Rhamnella rubrinervis TaxID=2594499 RepID=A0A8K0H884_9ROSA|nr:hypothetical protein FNV43_RR08454 [Rhamnella rubrinervis]
MGPLKRLGKASEKSTSTKATTTTTAVAIKKKSCEAEKSSNAFKENYSEECRGECSSHKFDRKTFVMIMRLNYGKFIKEAKMRNLLYNLWTIYFDQSGPMRQVEFAKAFEAIEFKYDNE